MPTVLTASRLPKTGELVVFISNKGYRPVGAGAEMRAKCLPSRRALSRWVAIDIQRHAFLQRKDVRPVQDAQRSDQSGSPRSNQLSLHQFYHIGRTLATATAAFGLCKIAVASLRALYAKQSPVMSRRLLRSELSQ